VPGIKDELEIETAALQKLARRNYGALYAISLLAIIASFFAGLSVALEWFGKNVLAVLSALPAVVLVASDRLNLEAKSKWYWEKFYALRAVLGALQYEGLDEAGASKKRTEIDAKYEPRWPGLGAAPKQGS
jgi:hypothetical protein